MEDHSMTQRANTLPTDKWLMVSHLLHSTDSLVGNKAASKQNKTITKSIFHVIIHQVSVMDRARVEVSVLTPVWKGNRERSLGRDEEGKVLAGWSAVRVAACWPLLAAPKHVWFTLEVIASSSSEPDPMLPTRQGRDSRRCHYWQSEIYV